MNCCIYRFSLSRNNCYRKSHFIAKHIYIYLLSIMMLLQCIVSTTNDVGLDNCGRNNDADMECKAYRAPQQQMVIRSPTILSLFPFLIYKSIFFGFHVRVLFPAKSTPKSLLPFHYLLITPTYLVLCAININFVVFKYLACMQCVCFSFGCYCLYLY